jgi:hypothetical protein
MQMARIAGRNGRLYANVTSGGTAEPITYLKDWSINFATDAIDVTALGDTGKVYVGGLPDASGDYSGFFDDSGDQFYTAAVDGVARKFYLYPSTSTLTKYWFGTAIFDFNVQGGVDGAVEVSGSWSAASSVAKVSS